jgi:hypothetical protein
LSKVSASPILKSSLIITGQYFGTLSNTSVFLVDSNGIRQYSLTVLSVSGTSIQCILGGGRAGAYNVVVLDSTNGLSSTNANSLFNY